MCPEQATADAIHQRQDAQKAYVQEYLTKKQNRKQKEQELERKTKQKKKEHNQLKKKEQENHIKEEIQIK